MNTALNYLHDTYADTDQGVVTRVGRHERGPYLVLDQTIFYPQGGGQPSDTGRLCVGATIMAVDFVGFNDGEVLHYIADEPPGFDALVGQAAEMRVDQARRLAHARLHTAGHVISGLVDAQRGPLRAVKGFHFPEGPYIEFDGKPESDAESLLPALQARIDALIAEDAPVNAALVNYDELAQRCDNLPAHLPPDKPLRVVTIGSLEPVPCGGTHVASLAELQGITLLKMKTKKGNTKISYQVRGVD